MKEFKLTRKLLSKWRELNNLNPDSVETNEPPAPFPTLLGYLKTDDRILDPFFRTKWISRFPRTKPPEPNNIWLVFKWDEFSFRTVKMFPPLPQVVDGFDYIIKENRLVKRWKFIRIMMMKALETVEFLHRSGYVHNAIRYCVSTDQQLLLATFL